MIFCPAHSVGEIETGSEYLPLMTTGLFDGDGCCGRRKRERRRGVRLDGSTNLPFTFHVMGRDGDLDEVAASSFDEGNDFHIEKLFRFLGYVFEETDNYRGGIGVFDLNPCR